MLEKIMPAPADAEFVKPKELRHVAVDLDYKGCCNRVNDTRDALEEKYDLRNKAVHWMLDAQAKLNIQILTIHILSAPPAEPDRMSAIVDSATFLFNELSINPNVLKNKVKVSVLGKWYDLPGKLVEAIKRVTEHTKEYDSFFLNICINYDGQEEIVDACRLVARKVLSEKIDLDKITKADIKENIYSSYFIPPQLIIKTGEPRQSDLLLWDSPGARIHFTGRPWPEFDQQDFIKALAAF